MSKETEPSNNLPSLWQNEKSGLRDQTHPRPAKHMVFQIRVHAATIQTRRDMPAGLASLTHYICKFNLCMSADFVSYTYCGLTGFYAQSHSNNGHVHATAACFAHALAQARPTMSYIPLVLLVSMIGLVLTCPRGRSYLHSALYIASFHSQHQTEIR